MSKHSKEVVCIVRVYSALLRNGEKGRAELSPVSVVSVSGTMHSHSYEVKL